MSELKQVLIVEDTDSGRALIRAWIEAAAQVAGKVPPKIREAKNGPEARREVLTYRPDKVILDAVLPGESAEDLALYFEQAGVPWIGVSAAQDPSPQSPRRLAKPTWETLAQRAIPLASLLWPKS